MVDVFDKYGVPRTWDWLQREFGPVGIHLASDGPGWRVVELWERDDLGPEALKALGPFCSGLVMAGAKLLDDGGVEAAAAIVANHYRDGAPVANLKSAFYWPDAPEAPDAGPLNGLPPGMVPGRADSGITNDNGDFGHPMGGGAYYEPPAAGPHAVWVYGDDVNSDVVYGLGMIAGTNHRHLDIFYVWDDSEPEPPSPGGYPDVYDEQGNPISWADFEELNPGVEYWAIPAPCFQVTRIDVRRQPEGSDECPMLVSVGCPGVLVLLWNLSDHMEQVTDEFGCTTFMIPQAWRQEHAAPMGNMTVGISGDDESIQRFRRLWRTGGEPDGYFDLTYEWVDDEPPPPPQPDIKAMVEEARENCRKAVTRANRAADVARAAQDGLDAVLEALG